MGKRLSFLSGAIIGSAVATVTALLFAPKSGRELRDDIQKELEDFKQQLDVYADIAVDRGQAVAERVQHAKEDICINLQDTAITVKAQLGETSDRLKEDFSESKEKLAKAYDKAKASAAELAQEIKEMSELADEAEQASEELEGYLALGQDELEKEVEVAIKEAKE